MNNGQHQFVIEVPANTSATFILPTEKDKVTTEYGKEGIVKNLHGKRAVEVQSGIYKFEA